ncbi:hypothetical protein PSPO01_07718 [Paraphaeosphaeria sporulosa]
MRSPRSEPRTSRKWTQPLPDFFNQRHSHFSQARTPNVSLLLGLRKFFPACPFANVCSVRAVTRSICRNVGLMRFTHRSTTLRMVISSVPHPEQSLQHKVSRIPGLSAHVYQNPLTTKIHCSLH